MANKPLQSIKFPDLPDTYTIPVVDSTLAVSGAAADAKETGDGLADKVDKVSGKGLSTEDYTTEEKTKLAGVETEATKTIIDSTLTATGNAADAKAVGDAIANEDKKALAAFATDTATGTIAHFTDGADNIPMKDVLVHIEPVQAGSGDPSPDNVRPITGWTGAKVTRTGKNLLINHQSLPYTANGVTWTENEDGSITANGTATDGNAQLNIRLADAQTSVPNATYRYGGCPDSGSGSTWDIYPWDRQENARPKRDEAGTGSAVSVFNSSTTQTFYMPHGHGCNLTLRVMSGVTADNLVFHPFAVLDGEDASWESPVGDTYSITFPAEAGTVYGGTVDVTKGELVVDRAIIASYAGESLPSTWISDRDVYSEGATPTTGAQVCYKLATPITYQLTPQEITSLLGENNVWADTGDSEVEYRADTKMYVDAKVAAAVSALS